MGAVFILRFALFAPYFLPPPAQEAAIRMPAALGEIPITSQHLCRGFLHGNEGHIWHHRPSFQPARPYPASWQAAVRKSHYPQVRCHGLRSNAVICFVRLQVDRSPLSEVLAPWPGGFSFRPGWGSPRNPLYSVFKVQVRGVIFIPSYMYFKFKSEKRTFIFVNYL